MDKKIRMLNFLEVKQTGTVKSVVFTGDGILKVYVTPQLAKDTEDTSVSGNTLTTIGLFFFRYVPNGIPEDQMPVYRLSVPMKISLTFAYEYDENAVTLSKDVKSSSYRVYELAKGDSLVKNVFYPKDTNAMFRVITKYIHGGKMPNNISYNELLGVYLDIFKIYDTKLSVPAVVLELMLSQMYRHKRNVSQPMRLAYNGKNVGPYDYRQVRVMKVPELESAFTGITATDVSHQILSAVLRNKEGKTDKVSPIEKYMKI